MTDNKDLGAPAAFGVTALSSASPIEPASDLAADALQSAGASLSDDTPRCCGCGKPLLFGEYKDCDCPTGCAFRRSDMKSVPVKPRCDQCNGYPVRANIDGDNLCQACCEKWVRAEGFAAQECEEPEEDTRTWHERTGRAI